MTLNDLKSAYGSEMMVAANLGFSIQTINNWAKAGKIPYDTQCVIQVETAEQFIAKKED